MWKKLFQSKEPVAAPIPVVKLRVLLQPMNTPKPIGFDIIDENNKTIGTLEYKEAIRALMEYENYLKQYLNNHR
jgi:hypothetical protein